MGRELQKKKNRSSNPRVKQKPKSKKLNLRANPVIAANWNKSQTLAQNYRRLGLVSRINARTGGVEKRASDVVTAADDALAIANRGAKTLVPGIVRIEREEGTGRILRVLEDDDEGKGKKEKGVREWNGRVLRDVLDEGDNEDDDDMEEDGDGRGKVGRQHDLPASLGDGQGGAGGEQGRGVIPELVMQAATGGAKKRPRKQSKREKEWVEQLVQKYGDDVGKMARDRKMNPMQQSEGDIGRRVRMWQEGRRKRGDVEAES